MIDNKLGNLSWRVPGLLCILLAPSAFAAVYALFRNNQGAALMSIAETVIPACVVCCFLVIFRRASPKLRLGAFGLTAFLVALSPFAHFDAVFPYAWLASISVAALWACFLAPGGGEN